ncbi:MAG: NADH-quinone oxidoreductase subunit L [Chloroflexi bacterium]|nr:NADH-quinone oxidoreductase subunit L [Chloroflexota bacterium]
MSEAAAWLVLFLPLASFLIISLVIRPFFNRYSQWAGYLTILAIGGALVLSLMALKATTGHEGPIGWDPHSWITVGSFNLRLGIYMNSLTAIMLVVVSGVSLMVQVYSQGYMKGDPGYARYFAFMSLFTASMLGLVLASNVVMLYAFWELVGLCSYLLIGFWYHRPAAAAAAKKAFIVTRLGDFGFLLAILYLFFHQGAIAGQGLNSLEIPDIYRAVQTGLLGTAVLTWLGLGIFAGAVGKSAQFPLHVWLPDAMEGPTPVSALIHAATMVAAGVFLVARFFPIFEAAPATLRLVAVIGGATAVFAATMGMVMNDIKRVVAYSTISQLGYMMLGLGVAGLAVAREGHVTAEVARAAVAIGIFHLFNHAFFKALLFLGSGSVNHATGTVDMRLMGGLRKVMPWTYITFVIAGLSLAGVWPLAGFWSKDEILAVALKEQPVLFALALLTVFMTAFYIFRVVFLTFCGEYRGGAPGEHGHDAHAHGKPHESPPVMVVPMVILSVLAVISGFWNVNGAFSVFMGEGQTKGFFEGFFGILAHPLPWIAMIVAGLGIFLAYLMYGSKRISAERMGERFKPIYTLFYRKYYFDELYENLFVRRSLVNGLFAGFQKFDTNVVDGAVNGLANVTVATGKGVRRWQTGQLQLYGLFMGIGIVVIVLVLLFAG